MSKGDIANLPHLLNAIIRDAGAIVFGDDPMLTLEEMIDAKAGREIKRAVAVKMALQRFQTKDICELLEVSDAFVSQWKIIYQNQGAEGLRLQYHGSEGFGSPVISSAHHRSVSNAP